MRVPFVGASNPHRSPRVSRERLLNGVAEIDPAGKFDRSCFARWGMKLFAALGSAGIRGMAEWDDNLYAVVGGDVKKVTSGGAVSTIGSIATNLGVVIFAPGPSHLVFVDGARGYYTQGSTVTEITDADFPDGATHVAWHSGRWLANDPANAGRAYSSDYNDPTAWNALNFATAERDPDALKAIVVANQVVWFAGDATTEAWAADAGDFGFAPMAGGYTAVGLAAPYSIAVGAGDSVFWLGKSRQGQGAVMRSAGSAGERISSAGLEDEFASYERIDDAIGFCAWHRGHGLYFLRFPTANKCWVWDESSRSWYEWTRYGGGAFRAASVTFAFGKTLLGDPADGNIFEFDADSHTDNGEPIEFWRYDRHIVEANERRPLFHNLLEVEVETGAGTLTIDQEWMMQYSDDGGHTWSRVLRRNSGKLGERAKRLLFRRLGKSRDRIYRIGCTDACKRVLVSGWLDADLGA